MLVTHTEIQVGDHTKWPILTKIRICRKILLKLTFRLYENLILELRSLLFCDVTQRILVISYQRFEVTYRSHPRGSSSPTILPVTVRAQLCREWCRQ